MIRIVWVDKRKEKIYYGDWHNDKKLEELLDWINKNNKMYSNTRYWLEKSGVDESKVENIIESEIVELEKEYLEIVR